MTLQGLPDFSEPMRIAGADIFYPYEGQGPHLLTPDAVELAVRNDGRPDFQLSFVRGQTPFLPPKPYGMIELRLRARYPLDQGLMVLRQSRPHATLAPLTFRSGFLRLTTDTELTDQPTELLEPTPLTWNGLGISRSLLKLSLEGATIVRRSLEGEVLPLTAIVELELLGVSPRLPMRVSFDPHMLLDQLWALGAGQPTIAHADIELFFRQPRAALPLEIIGNLAEEQLGVFAAVMTDRIRQRWGSFSPAPTPDEAVYITLPDPAGTGSGSFTWDLSEPLVVPRTLVLRLNPLAAARQLVEREGLATVLHEVVVPRLMTGAHEIAISANLPPERSGVFAIGVKLWAPPQPPMRSHIVNADVNLHAPNDQARVVLRLAANEPLEYHYTTFAVIQDATGIEELNGAELQSNADVLRLTTDSFPIDFITVEAARALLELAKIQLVLHRLDRDAIVEQTFELSMEQPALALALPKQAADATLLVVARDKSGAGSLTLGPLPASDLFLDRFSFAQYGPQQVEITCVFETGALSFAIEVSTEDDVSAARAPTVLHFRPEQPARVWNWFADSPFRPGYHFRPYQGPNNSPAAWSEAQPPGEPLIIHVPRKENVSDG